jgi:hypothetical protein
MLEHDMRNLMRQHRRELALVVGEPKDPARHIDVATGQCEGIDLGAIQDRDGEARIGLVRSSEQTRHDLRQHHLGLAVRIDPAIGRHDPRMLARADRFIVRIAGIGDDRRHLPVDRGDLRPHERRAAGKQHQRRGRPDALQPASNLRCHAHGPARTSICSGCVTSMRGPS